MSNLLFTEAEWDFEALDRTQKAIEEIALNDLKLDVYPNQIEVISSEQMLDAYSSLGMPLMYNHWSFGKLFAREETLYRAGFSALAYEIVINSSPCISYLLEENTMTMQALVMAHAAFGHNHFFKNNYLFRQWTNAEGILDYLAFAKRYIAACEERHGREAVESVLDAAHALMDQGVFRYRRPPKPSKERVLEKRRRRAEYEEEAYSELWRTLPAGIEPPAAPLTLDEDEDFSGDMKLPEENLLYFLEKHSPTLKAWQREILRIVRNLAQYFYPQRQTKVMNEGCATFVHHAILNLLYDRGLISEGSLLEFLHSHTSAVFQPEFNDSRYSGINPYALGFAMMNDIRRIAEDPSEEDRDWFPSFAGSGDWIGALQDAWANYRDESFVEQFLSPKLMRDFRLFALFDKAEEGSYKVSAIHNEGGYRKVRSLLARQYDVGAADPNIQVVGATLKGDRTLFLTHRMHRGVPLHHATKKLVLTHIERLWGHDVVLEETAD
ncbi:MAG: SpoVR family protein [Rhizomicrobium sp.]|jgi:spore cortex formation protein SpoVR/YcgB (stage V sporulation)